MHRQSFLPGPQRPPTKLLEECLSGDVAAVHAILAADGANVNLEAELDNGWTALQAAAHYQYLDIARLLVEHGAKLDVTGGPHGKSPLHIAVEDGNTALAQMLLENNASPNGLAPWGAPLHGAVRAENRDVVQLLLDAGAVTELLNDNGETPLIIAAGQGSTAIAKQLLERGADPDSGKAVFNSPLLAACQVGHLDVAALLLDSGASIDKANAEDSTPLLFAVRADNVDLAKLLLRRGASTTIRGLSILDAPGRPIQNPEMLQALQVQGPIQGPRITAATAKRAAKKRSTLQFIMPPSEDDLHKQRACRGFHITMVDFYVGGGVEERLPVTASVHSVLYGDGPKALLESARAEARIRHAPDFTWYHIPANNLTWAEHLITRLKAEKDGPKVTKRQMRLQRLEQSVRAQLHFAQPNPSKAATAGDTFLKSFCSPDSTLGDDAAGRAVMLVLPYLHFETFDSFRSMSRTLDAAKTRADSRPPAQQYVAFDDGRDDDGVAEEPTQNIFRGMRIPSVTSTINRRGGSQTARVMSPSSLAEYGGAEITKAWSAGQASPIYHRRRHGDAISFRTFPPAALRNTARAEALDMTSLSLRSEAATPPLVPGEKKTKEESNPLSSTSPESDLVLGYMGGEHIDDRGFQPRRTLDQYKYSHLGSIGERDGDQVVYRYTKAKKQDPKIFMVDQLWMWVLEDNTLVTCTPLRWDAIMKDLGAEFEPKSGPTDTRLAFRRQFPFWPVATEQGPRLKSATAVAPTHLRPHMTKFGSPFQIMPKQDRGYKTAHAIADDKAKTRITGLKDDPMDIHQSVLKHLKDVRRLPIVSVHDLASLVASHCVDVFDHHEAPEEFQFFDFFEQCLTNLVDGGAQCLKEVQEAVNKSTFCSITHEIESLIEIADILDELEILKAVLEDQGDVIHSFNNSREHRVSISLQEESSASSLFSVDSTVRESHLARIDGMERSARKIEETFYRITDLKQKHASQQEAASAAEQARETARQGNAIVLFTVVTIVFLPISFMAAFFTINIDELHVTANGKLPLGYVVKHMLGVGLGLSIPFILIAFNLDVVAKGLRAIKNLTIPRGRAVVLAGLGLGICGIILITIWTSHLTTNMKTTVTVVVGLALLLAAVTWGMCGLVARARAPWSLTSTSGTAARRSVITI